MKTSAYVMLLLCGLLLSSCHGFDCAVLGLHGYACDPVYPVACTPESRAMGYCKDVPLKQAGR
jgi:hypothetical protein